MSLSHPIDFVLSLVAHRGDVQAIELSTYVYIPQTVDDRRVIEQVAPGALESSFDRLSRSLREGEEMAIHSRIRLRDSSQIRHLPMIDFKGDLETSHIERLTTLARDFGCREIALFYTGRSYHFYGSELMSTDDWRRFLGRALLLNMPGEPEWVDARWVGHGLIAGFSSLRWTSNNPYYKAIPQLAWHADQQRDKPIRVAF